jgi:two-component system sensor kinase FixL
MIEERTRELRDAQDQLLRQERLTVLGQLAGGIGHELRSPLGAIKNATYLLNLSLKTRDPDVLETLDILKRQVDASDRIITSLLDFARAKPPYRREANVRELIDAALAQVGISENIAIQREFDGALPDLSVDLDQLQIVFGNLIRNAVQAMPDGGKLTIAARQSALSFRAEREISGAPAQDFSSPNASRRVEMTGVEISFCDTGSGIAPDLMDKIFQPLFTTKARGMGLGLALCKLLVEGHDGKIQVTSQVGKGTTFVVYLPVLS